MDGWGEGGDCATVAWLLRYRVGRGARRGLVHASAWGEPEGEEGDEEGGLMRADLRGRGSRRAGGQGEGEGSTVARMRSSKLLRDERHGASACERCRARENVRVRMSELMRECAPRGTG